MEKDVLRGVDKKSPSRRLANVEVSDDKIVSLNDEIFVRMGWKDERTNMATHTIHQHEMRRSQSVIKNLCKHLRWFIDA